MPTPYDSPNFDQAFVITPSVVQTIQGPNASNGKPTPYCTAFMSDTTGTVVVEPKGGGAVVTIPVISGVLVRLALRRLVSVSTAMVVTGFL